MPDPEEQRLAQAVPADKQTLLMQEIQLLTVRERRMLKRIELLRNAADEENKLAAGETGMTAVGHKKGLEKDKETDLFEYRGKLGQIQNIEDALTRVQARKQAAIDALHRYGVDDARLELETMKVDLAALKLGAQEQEVENDGFLEALNTEAQGCGRMRMKIKERIAGMKAKLQAMKQQRGVLTKVQVFKFQPFSRRQKQVLTWWLPNSPVKDYDGIIADGAIRSGKTVCMSLSLCSGQWRNSTVKTLQCVERR